MKHIAIITEKPIRSGYDSIPDGAINGNGDLSVILGNCDNGMRIFISKCDLWLGVERHDMGGIKPLAYIDIPIDSELYANYYVEQNMDIGEIVCRFVKKNDVASIIIRVSKSENSIIIENVGNVEIEPVLKYFTKNITGKSGEFVNNELYGIYRNISTEDCVYKTNAYSAIKKVNHNTWYLFAATNHDCDNPEELVISKVKSVTLENINAIKSKHIELWKEFWSKSSFIISDKNLENNWYASQYFLAVSTGNKKFSPGIFANFITIENVNWHGDYHLNYNYQAPFYAACSSNHIEFTDCYHSPLEEMYTKGRACAKKFGCRGILLPVGIAPKGLYTELDYKNPYWFERLFLGQKSNGIHPADIMVFRWKTTRDLDYAKKHAYPFIKENLLFFEDYAVFENGRYSVYRDSVHEVPYYKSDFNPKKYQRFINDKNNVLTLGLLRLCLEAAIDMSEALDIDKDKRKKWIYMLEHLSPFPTCIRFGKKVYRYTESGQRWNDTGDVGLQHIYPCGAVGLSSSEEDLKIARNTFRQKEHCCRTDGNAVSSFYPMAARLGINPKKIIKQLKEHNSKHQLQNLLFNHGGGCLENCSICANTLNEMALQSHENIIRIFPVWDSDIDCEYTDLRAYGAFLVSASIRKGKIGTVKIFSENGSKLTVSNPFKKCRICRDTNEVVTEDDTIFIDTKKGETIYFSEV